MRHMGANFHSQFKNKTLMKLFKQLCSQNQERKFNLLWKKLDELTKKQTTEFSKRPVNTEEDDQVSLEDMGLDGPNVRRKRRRAIKTFVRIDGPRGGGGELGLFQFLKQNKATLTYAMLVGHQFTNRITKLPTQAKRDKTK